MLLLAVCTCAIRQGICRYITGASPYEGPVLFAVKFSLYAPCSLKHQEYEVAS